eukprot:5311833-Pyramimonas_sp.AAC.1
MRCEMFCRRSARGVAGRQGCIVKLPYAFELPFPRLGHWSLRDILAPAEVEDRYHGALLCQDLYC